MPICNKAVCNAETHRKIIITPNDQIFPNSEHLTTLLLGDTDGTATATSGLGVLATDTESPVVTKTTMSTDLLEAL
jgi:hypothetical protein